MMYQYSDIDSTFHTIY